MKPDILRRFLLKRRCAQVEALAESLAHQMRSSKDPAMKERVANHLFQNSDRELAEFDNAGDNA